MADAPEEAERLGYDIEAGWSVTCYGAVLGLFAELGLTNAERSTNSPEVIARLHAETAHADAVLAEHAETELERARRLA